MSGRTSASVFLNSIVLSRLIEGAARLSHKGWYAKKQRDLENPENPFKGWGPTRKKVKDLKEEERTDLGIPTSADPTADVFNPTFREFDLLTEDEKGKNVIPLMLLCHWLGSIALPADATVRDLESFLESLIAGKDAKSVHDLSVINHIGFLAGELRVGIRPYRNRLVPQLRW